MGDMKLIVGHPGLPDGHIKPEKMARHHGKRKSDSNKDELRIAELNKAIDTKMYLFNITGTIQLQYSF